MKRIILLVLVCLGGITAARGQSPGVLSLAESAAGKIKSEEIGAKARRAAVRYLGNVDWHYYPEAEAALIAALRADRNESVRVEAARSLGLGTRSTKKTTDALNMVLTGSEEDGNPAELSDKVKAAAQAALRNCQVRSAEVLQKSVRQAVTSDLQLVTASAPPKAMPLSKPTAIELNFAENFGTSKTTSPATSQPNLLQHLVKSVVSRDGPELQRAHTSPPANAARISGLTPIGMIPRE